MADQFTMKDSLEDILNNERICKKINYIFSPIHYEHIKPMFRKMKLKNMVKFSKNSEGKTFPAEGFLRCANFLYERRLAGEQTSISLWRDLPDDQMEKLEKVVLIPFTKADRQQAPCVIICPGGAYNRVSMHNEGIPVAEELCAKGYQVFILNYRVYPDIYPAPVEDVLRAIGFVRKNHQRLGINPENITLMGFSAGGHLCAMAGALYDRIEDQTHRYDDISARPDKICLGYPVISFVDNAHEGSVLNFLGEKPKDEDKKALSAELIVSSDYPPVFLWACEDDSTVSSENTKLMAAALEHKGVRHEMKLYPTGGHGIGLGKGTSAEGWIDEAVAFLDK